MSRPRNPSEILRRGYSDDELHHLYALARISLEAGAIKRAELIAQGLVEINPTFVPGWLILSYVAMWNRDHEQAAHAAQQAFRLAPRDASSMLYSIGTSLLVSDIQEAGTVLGELGELIEAGRVSDPDLVRLYRMLLARFQTRTR